MPSGSCNRQDISDECFSTAWNLLNTHRDPWQAFSSASVKQDTSKTYKDTSSPYSEIIMTCKPSSCLTMIFPAFPSVVDTTSKLPLGFGRESKDCLDRVAEELCEFETISGDRLREIIAQYTEVPEKLAVV